MSRFFRLMARSFFQGSGIVSIMASGRSTPFMTRNSIVLSSMAESEPEAFTTGKTRSIFPRSTSEESVSSRASIRSTLPRMVLISPLWSRKRLGCARSQEGVVLVEKREWTMAIAEV